MNDTVALRQKLSALGCSPVELDVILEFPWTPTHEARLHELLAEKKPINWDKLTGKEIEIKFKTSYTKRGMLPIPGLTTFTDAPHCMAPFMLRWFYALDRDPMGNYDLSATTHILQSMNPDPAFVASGLEYFRKHGGYDDTEVYLNVILDVSDEYFEPAKAQALDPSLSGSFMAPPTPVDQQVAA